MTPSKEILLNRWKFIADLLDVGTFPGSLAGHLLESQKFIQTIIKAIEDEAAQEGPASEQDT